MATLGRRKSNLEKLLGAVGLIAAVGLVLHMALAKADGPVTRGALWIAEPFIRMGSGIHESASGAWLSVFEGERLRRQNEELQARLLEAQLTDAAEIAEKTLSELSERVSTNLPVGGMELITVPVLAAPNPGDRQVIWLGMGAREGLAPGMAVLGPSGVIGLVETCTDTMAQVRLITDLKSQWGAEVADLAELGLLIGTGSGDRVELHFNRTVTEAQVGQAVTTSGMAGSIAPAALPFGEIIEIARNRKGEPMAVVKLAANPALLRTVWVLPERRLSTEVAAP